MSTVDEFGFWAGPVIAIGAMVIAPIVVWRTNSRYPQIRHPRLKWACLIAWQELIGVAIVCFTVNSLLGYPALGNLLTLAMICLVFLTGPVAYFLNELDPLMKARRKAQRLTRQAARRQPQSNEAGEVEV